MGQDQEVATQIICGDQIIGANTGARNAAARAVEYLTASGVVPISVTRQAAPMVSMARAGSTGAARHISGQGRRCGPITDDSGRRRCDGGPISYRRLRLHLVRRSFLLATRAWCRPKRFVDVDLHLRCSLNLEEDDLCSNARQMRS
jgi:hypothetical protein